MVKHVLKKTFVEGEVKVQELHAIVAQSARKAEDTALKVRAGQTLLKIGLIGKDWTGTYPFHSYHFFDAFGAVYFILITEFMNAKFAHNRVGLFEVIDARTVGRLHVSVHVCDTRCTLGYA